MNGVHLSISLEENYAEHLVSRLLRGQSKSRTDLLRKQLAELDLAIKELVASDPVLSEKSARLEQIAGVGKITAWIMLSEVPELGTLEKGEAAALVGVAPNPNESGQRRSPRRISGGRAAARRVLYMAAISASQQNTILKAFYQRLRSQGKAGKVALVAVVRKLVELFNLLLHKDRSCPCKLETIAPKRPREVCPVRKMKGQHSIWLLCEVLKFHLAATTAGSQRRSPSANGGRRS